MRPTQVRDSSLGFGVHTRARRLARAALHEETLGGLAAGLCLVAADGYRPARRRTVRRLLLGLVAFASLGACGTSVGTDTGSSGDGARDVSASEVIVDDRVASDGPFDAPRDVVATDVAVSDVVPTDVPSIDARDATISDTPTADTAVTDAIGTDGAVIDVASDAPASDAAVCSIVGTYRLTFMGMTVYFRFNADGTWDAAMTFTGLSMPLASGRYTLSGSRLTFMDTTMTGCAVGDVGMYTLAWSPGCDSFQLTLISDGCTSRGTALSSSPFVRETGPVVDGGAMDSGSIDAAGADAAGADVAGDGISADVPVDSAATDGGACPLVGVYRITIMGMPFYFRFDAMGRWALAASVPELDTAPGNMGTYTYDPATGVFTFTDDRSCTASMVGRYRIAFGAGCTTITFMLMSDPCTGRGAVVDGLVATRT